VHQLRKECDAILVGAETVERDNPTLTIRRLETDRQPLRIVIDPNNRIASNAALLQDGLETLHMTSNFRGLEALLNQLGDREIQRLLVEGGPATVQQFLKAGFVDEFYLVKSNVEHIEPVPSMIDDLTLQQAGLARGSDEQWGDETVQFWSR
jgi:diaminohydroxyphosphoribosylaminopyrimidine deaminase/5-amino-6-(5-phosphoribosylamino)uracil reductase